MKKKCCGVPLIANGFFDKARKNAKLNMAQFADNLTHTECVVTTEPSCAMTLRDEYPEVLRWTTMPYGIKFGLFRLFNRGVRSGNQPTMQPLNLRVVYHSRVIN